MLSKTLTSSLIAIAIVIGFFASTSKCNGQRAPIKINRVDDVIANWSKSQHLFVKGQLGISDSQFQKLEAWISDNAPNWTVVLMQDANQEFYAAEDGRQFRNMEAVRFALGHRLNNQTDFGSITHEKTGEASGAVFVLFLKERKFSYYGSDVHDRRNLGESKWKGSLDREAVRAMRNGGRIIDAVKNTIKLIDGGLARKIAAEESQARQAEAKAERAIRERKREIENLKSRIARTDKHTVKRVEIAARELKSNFPKASHSKLALPPIEKWRNSLASQLKTLSAPDVNARKTKLAVDSVEAQINRFLDAYAAHAAFEEMITPVESRLDEIADDPSGAANEISREAYRLLDQARDGHAIGELEFSEPIHQASEKVKQGKEAIRLEHVRVREQAERKSLIQKTIGMVALVLGAITLGLLWFLNARRRPALRQAHALFDKRSRSVEGELEQVDQILTRSEQVIGTPESLAQKKFAGQTLMLGNSTHRDIEGLREMSSEAQRAIETAGALIHPSSPLAEATNMFSSARYRLCVDQLNGSSLQVPRSDQTDAKSDSPGWVTFNEFFNELHNRKKTATSKIDTFENSVESVNQQVDELQQNIDQAGQLEQELSRASRLDRWFKIPNLFEELLPAAQADCDAAESIVQSDPVKAVGEVIPVGRQKIDDGLSLIRSIQIARDDVFPKLDQSGDQLKQLRYKTRWIDDSIGQLSDRANELIGEATKHSVEAPAVEFESDVRALGQRATRTLELAQQVEDEVLPAIENLRQSIAEGRNKISMTLKIPVTTSLKEAQYDPDLDLSQAQQQFESAKAAINYGGVESAMESIEEVSIELGQGHQLVDSSLFVMEQFVDQHSRQTKTHQDLSSTLADRESLIDSTQARYADTALKIRDESFIQQNNDLFDDQVPTVVSLLENSHSLLKNLDPSLGQSQQAFEQGAVLAAANQLSLIENEQQDVDQMLSQIDLHCKQVGEVASNNKTLLDKRVARMDSLADDLSDNRTQQATIVSGSALQSSVSQFFEEFNSSQQKRDPFADSTTIEQLEEQLDVLVGELQADRNAFETASNAVSGGEFELVVAQRLVARSLNDSIPDSVEIKKCQNEVTTLEVQLGRLQKSLQEAHGNWVTVNSEAIELNMKLAVVSGRLRRELERARRAVDLVATASADVFAASNWRGKYGIVVVGNPGANELSSARSLLANGNYHRSIELSRAASMLSKNGIDAAKRQVSRKRRRLAREAEEARRRRRRRRQSSFSSSSSSFGSRSSSSSFGSRSSSSSFGSRSSSSSSSSRSSGGGSGFGTSGW